jgi:hypothetical protein
VVCWYHPAAIVDRAFIFEREQVEEGYAGLSTVERRLCTLQQQFTYFGGFKSFPDKARTTFSKIGWQ